MELKNRRILFYDGDCRLCNWAVNFIIDHERNTHLYFASLNSEVAKKVLKPLALSQGIDSLILLESGGIYIESEAVIKISKHLKFPYSLAGVAVVLPRSLADKLYRYVAKNRIKWFGQNRSCRLYDIETRKRFLG